MEKVNKLEKIRLGGRVSKADYYRLEQIRKRYGFKSCSEIVSCLTRSFIRVADPDNNKANEPVSAEIKEMFVNLSETESMDFIKPKRRCNTTIHE